MSGKINTPSVFFALLFVSYALRLTAQNAYDSLKLKQPKHYFNTTFVLDGYAKPTKKITDTLNPLSKRLKSYGIKQFNLSFQIPVFTADERGIGADSNVISNHHVLVTGNFMRLKPAFGGISEHILTKRGIGVRYVYNTGKKAVWFFDVAPFVTRDISSRSKAYFRLASTIVYSRNETNWFNWRIGATKSFLWGNRFYLPFIGVRFGRLDKVNFSLQFPRRISLNIPLGPNGFFSLFSRGQGGMYNFSNVDSLYFIKNVSTFHFTRYEINTGFRFDLRLQEHFNFYISSGLSTQNNITFYSERANATRPRAPYKKYFYSKNMPPTLFFELGFVLKFGKTRSYYNNKNIYDAIDLNNQHQNNGNAQIPLTPKKVSKNSNLESIQDLIDYTDF